MKTASIRAAGGTQGFANAVEMRGVENWQPACDHHGVPPYFKMNDARPHPPIPLPLRGRGEWTSRIVPPSMPDRADGNSLL